MFNIIMTHTMGLKRVPYMVLCAGDIMTQCSALS